MACENLQRLLACCGGLQIAVLTDWKGAAMVLARCAASLCRGMLPTSSALPSAASRTAARVTCTCTWLTLGSSYAGLVCQLWAD